MVAGLSHLSRMLSRVHVLQLAKLDAAALGLGKEVGRRREEADRRDVTWPTHIKDDPHVVVACSLGRESRIDDAKIEGQPTNVQVSARAQPIRLRGVRQLAKVRG